MTQTWHLKTEHLVIEYQKSPSERLKTEILSQYRRLVEHIARKLSYNRHDQEDLAQVGLIGLLKAVDLYDASRDIRFITFSTSHIMGEIKHYLRDKTRMIRVPRRLQDINIQMKRFSKTYYDTHGKYPSVTEIAQGCQVSEEEILESMEAIQFTRLISLDAPISVSSADGSDFSLIDSLGVDGGMDDMLIRDSLTYAVSKLSDRERHIVQMRFYDNLTQQEIADRLNLSQMHVSRLITKAVGDLRRHIKLTDF